MSIQKKAAHAKAVQMYLNGMAQKDIAELLDVRPATICKWVNNTPQAKAAKAMAVLQDRLIKEARKMTVEEITKLSDAISKQHKIATHTVQNSY